MFVLYDIEFLLTLLHSEVKYSDTHIEACIPGRAFPIDTCVYNVCSRRDEIALELGEAKRRKNKAR